MTKTSPFYRFLSMLLVVLMLVSISPVQALADANVAVEVEETEPAGVVEEIAVEPEGEEEAALTEDAQAEPVEEEEDLDRDLPVDELVPAEEEIDARDPGEIAEPMGRDDVATVDYADGESFESYTSLEAAIAAAGTEVDGYQLGTTVKLTKDVTLSETLTIDKAVTIDLNGKTVTSGKTAFVVTGDVTVVDAVGGGLIKSGNCGIQVVRGSLTFNSGAVTAQEMALMAFDGGNVVINGGTFTAIDNAVLGTNGTNGRGGNTITVNGGTFNGGITSSGYVACGIYAANDDTWNVNAGTFNITNGAGIVARAGKVNVGSGVVINTTGNTTGKVGDSRVVVPCAAIVFDSAAGYPGLTAESKLAVTGGTFNSDSEVAPVANVGDDVRVAISGGTFSGEVSEEYFALGYVPAQNADGTWGVALDANVAKVGSTKYATFAEAAAAAVESDGTVELINNVPAEDIYTLAAGKVLKVQTNGRALADANVVSGNEAYYVLAAEGTFTSTHYAAGLWWYLLDEDVYEHAYYKTAQEAFDAANLDNEIPSEIWLYTSSDAAVHFTELGQQLVVGVNVNYPEAHYTGNNTAAEGLLVKMENVVDVYGGSEAFLITAIRDPEYAKIKVVKENGDVYGYDTWSGIFIRDCVDAGDTVILQDDVPYDYNTPTYWNKAGVMTLDLNGHKFYKPGSGIAIATNNADAVLIIKDSSEAKTGTITNTPVRNDYVIEAGPGTIKIEGGTIGADENTNMGAVNVTTNGKIEISGGTINGKVNKTGTGKFEISGGIFSEPVSPEDCAYGYVPVTNDDGTYGVKANFVAQIGEKQYATLADAVAAAADGDTVTMIADTTTEQVTVDKSITLDLNGKTVTGNAQLLVAVNGVTLTIVDSGENGTLNNTASGTIVVRSAGTVVVKSGTVSSELSNAIIVASNSTADIQGGTVYTKDSDTVKVNAGADKATIKISGGEVKSDKAYTIANGHQGTRPTNTTIVISGGSVTGLNGAVYSYSETSSVEISGGTITGTPQAVYVLWGKLEITDGNIEGPVVVGYGARVTANAEIKGGNFKGDLTVRDGSTLAISGGFYSSEPKAEYIVQGKAVVESDKEGYPYTVGNAVAQVGTVGYATFTAAVAAANGTETITLLADIDEAYTIKVDETLKVALNEKTLTVNPPDGYVVKTSKANDVTTYTVAMAVAQIDDKLYASLAEAAKEAEDGDTITMLADSIETETAVVEGKGITLDLSGKTVNATADLETLIQVNDAGNLTIQDSVGGGKLNGTKVLYQTDATAKTVINGGELTGTNRAVWATAGAVEIHAGATLSSDAYTILLNGDVALTMDGGDVISTNEAIRLQRGAAATITGGKIKSTGTWGVVIGSTGGSFTLTDGEIEANGIGICNHGTTKAGDASTIAINGGTVNANIGIYHPGMGNLTITGGTITAGTGVVMRNGKLVVTGGTIHATGAAEEYDYASSGSSDTGDALQVERSNYGSHIGETFNGGAYSGTEVVISGGHFISDNGKAVASYIKADDPTQTDDGTARAEGFISGGFYSSEPAAEYIVRGKAVVETGDKDYPYTVGDAVAEIGTVGYATLAAAINAAENDETVILLKDTKIDSIEVGKTVKLDLGGKEVSSDAPQLFKVTKDGDLTITGNGKITGPENGAAFDGKALITVDGGKLTVENGTLTATGSGSDGMYGVYVLAGGTAIFGEPTITSHFAAIGTNNTTAPATITVNGGTYTANATPSNNEWWSYFCAPIYAASSGAYTIKGGTFNGYYGFSSRYANVDQDVAINGGTFNASSNIQIFVDEKSGTAGTTDRSIVSTNNELTLVEHQKWIPVEGETGKYTIAFVYTVTFNLNGGSIDGDANDVVKTEVIRGTTIGAVKPANPVRTNYTFVEWSVADDVKVENEDVTVYALYKGVDQTIIFSDGMGNVLPNGKITKNYGDVLTAEEFKALAEAVTINKTDLIEKKNLPENKGDFEWTLVDDNLWAPALPTGETTVDQDLVYNLNWVKVHTVTFVDVTNGITTLGEVKVLDGENATELAPAPTKEGYHLVGWYNGNNEYKFDTPVTEDITLTAKWEANKYTVTFTAAGETVATQTVEYNSKATVPADPEKEHYDFVTWYTDEGLTTEFDFDTPITEDITLYAKFEKHTYTVTFQTYGGTEIEPQYVVYGGKATKPTDPTREGYRFWRWHATENMQSNAYNFDTAVESDLTLYAEWIQQYTLHFDNNGWETGKTIADKKADVKDGEAKTSIYFFTDWLPEVTKDGVLYTFSGWATKPDATYEELEYPYSGVDGNGNLTIAQLTSRPVTLTDDLTVYAIYEVEYTLTLDLNGGSGNVATTHKGDKGNVVSFSFSTFRNTRSGYTLLGFDENKDATEPAIKYQSGSYYIHLTKDTTLYAIWAPNEYTVTFKANGGVGTVPETITFTLETEKIVLPGAGELTKDAREFLGWYAGSSISDLGYGKNLSTTQLKNFYEAGAELPVTAGNKTLLAVWRNVGVKVNYDLNGHVTTAGKVSANKSEFFDYGVAKAFATQNATYEGKVNDFTYPDGKNYTANAGWYDAATDTYYRAGTTKYTLNKDNTKFEDGQYSIDLVMAWTYTPVAFLNEDGTLIKRDFVYRYSTDKTIKANYTTDIDAVIAIEGPAKTGYTFQGWATEKGGEVVYKADDEITTIKSIDLYPIYTINQYTVTFDVNDPDAEKYPVAAIDDVKDDFGTEIELPQPTKTGYTFVGWVDLEEEVAEGEEATVYTGTYTIPAANVKLTAQWEQDVYTILFVDYDGTVLFQTNSIYGNALRVETPEHEGYRFDGWYVGAYNEETGKYESDYTKAVEVKDGKVTITGDLIAVAKFVKQYTLYFDNNGWEPGKTVAPKTKDVDANGEAKATIGYTYGDMLPNLTKDGKDYVFVGWATDPEASYDEIEYPVNKVENGKRTIEQMTVRTVVLTSDLTVYAIYEPLYTLTIDLNGGSGNVATTHSGSTGGNCVSFSHSTYKNTRSGYELIGFSEDKNATEPEIQYLTSGYYWMHLTKDTTLYAIWKPIEYTVTFKANGGVGTVPETITFTVETEKIVLPGAGELTKDAREFLGWYAGSSISDLGYGKNLSTTQLKNFYEAGAELPVTAGNKTLLAVWRNVGVKVNYDLNGHVTTAGKVSANKSEFFDYGVAKAFATQAGTYEGKVNGFTYPDGKNLTGSAAWYDAATDTYYKAGSIKYTLDSSNTKLGEDGIYSLDLIIAWNYTPVTFHNEDDTVLERLFVQRKSSGTTVANFKVDVTAVTALDGIEKAGYTFQGWATEKGGEVAYEAGTEITTIKSIDLYPIYTINQYTVSFDVDGGEEIKAISADYNTAIELPEATKKGYTFKGWAEEAEGEVKYAAGESFTVTEDVTLYAIYEINEYTVTFISDDETFATVKVLYGETIPEISFEGLVKEHYTFQGWTSVKGGTEVEYTQVELAKLVIEGDTTLYAIWTANQYTIHFDLNGGDSTTEKDVTQAYGTNYRLTVTTNKAAREGYQFLGWDRNPEATDPEYYIYYAGVKTVTNKYYTVAVDGDVTLYAIWGYNWHLSYDGNAGDDTVNNLPRSDNSGNFGTWVNFSTYKPTRGGYTFKYWSYTPDGEQVTDNFVNKNGVYTAGWYKIEKDTTLYAIWEANTYTVTFDLNGGTGVELPEDVTYTTEARVDIKIPEGTPTKEHATFVGWSFTQKSLKNPTDLKWNGTASNGLYNPGDTIKAEDLKLYDCKVVAVWRLDKVTLTLDKNGGPGPNGYPKDFSYGDNTSMPIYGLSYKKTIDKAITGASVDYALVKALYSPETDTYYKTGSSGKITMLQDTTIIAIWEYTLITYMDGETVVGQNVSHFDLSSMSIDKPAVAIDGPEKEHATFKGWATEEGGEVVYKAGAEIAVIRDTTLYAIYENETVNVTFDVDGETKTVAVDYGTAVAEPETPVKEGYIFDGWFKGDEAYDFTTPVTEDITLTAKFTEAVAKIGDVYYTSLAAAAADAKDGDKIEMIANSTETTDIALDKDVTVDLGGYTVTASAIRSTGKVSITNGTLVSSRNYLIYVEGGELTLGKDLTVEAKGTAATVKVGELIVDGAEINAGEYAAFSNNQGTETSKITVKSGKITSKKYPFDVRMGCTLTVEGGTIEAPALVLWVSHETGVINVTGGEFVSGNFALLAQKGTVTISGGVFNGKVQAANGATIQASDGYFQYYVIDEYVVEGKICTSTAIAEREGKDYYILVPARTVKFVDGENVTEIVVPEGETIPEEKLPANPTKEGSTFEGWFNGDEAFDPTTAVTEDLTLTAQWTEDVYTVTFVDGDEVLVQFTAKYGDKLPQIEEPTKEGYTFTGWDPELAETVTENVTYTAKWEVFVDTTRSDVVANNVAFTGAMQLHTFIRISDEVLADPNAYVTITFNGETESFKVADAPVSTSNGVERRDFIQTVYAAMMRDEIEVRLYDGEGNLLSLYDRDGNNVTGTGYHFCVMDYLEGRIANSTNAKMVELAKAAKNYGTAAQRYFGYHTEQLTSDDIAALEAAISDEALVEGLSAYEAKTSGTLPAGIEKNTSNVQFMADNSLYEYFYLEGDAEISDYTFTVDGKEVEPVYAGGRYSVKVANIASGNLGMTHTFTVSDGTDTYTIEASALSYAYGRVLNSSDPNMVKLAKALYLYSVAASNYFAR